MVWTRGGGGPSVKTEHWEPVQLVTDPSRLVRPIAELVLLAIEPAPMDTIES